jgi:hypothetical protein
VIELVGLIPTVHNFTPHDDFRLDYALDEIDGLTKCAGAAILPYLGPEIIWSGLADVLLTA